MLILTRRPGQTLYIGDDIEIVVLDMTRYQVRVGIKAPRQVSIVRSELRERDRENGVLPKTPPDIEHKP